MSHVAKQPTLFEVFGRSETSVVPEINESALQSLVTVLLSGDREEGKVVLLRSPRAGYGKTLLLQAAHEQTGEAARFFAVEPSGGGRVDGEVVLESLLRQLATVLPGSGGLTEFDFFTRKLLAIGLKPLLISGEIPSHDREGALYAIEQRPVETFDFHHQQAATAHWTQANFEVLGPRLASELSEFSKSGLRDCAYWVDLLFRYATTPPEKVERSRLLSDSVFADLKNQGGSAAEDRLQSLLGLLGLIQPVVLVFDETEGLSNQPEAGLRVAAFIAQLRQACPGLTVILSVNEDVWKTGLAPLMPGGLEDRLTEYVIELGELTRDEAGRLLKNRFGDAAGLIESRLKWTEPLYARALLKESAEAARELSAAGYFADHQISESGERGEVKGAVASPPPLEAAILENSQEAGGVVASAFAASSVGAVTAAAVSELGAAETAPAEEVAVEAPEEAPTAQEPQSVEPEIEPAASFEAEEAEVESAPTAPVVAETSPFEESSPFEIASEPAAVVPAETPSSFAAEAQENVPSATVGADVQDFAAEVPPRDFEPSVSPSASTSVAEDPFRAQPTAQPAAPEEASNEVPKPAAGGIFEVMASQPARETPSASNPFTVAEPSESSVPQPASQPILPKKSPFDITAPESLEPSSDFSAPAARTEAPAATFAGAKEAEPVSVDHAREWVARQVESNPAMEDQTTSASSPAAEKPVSSPFEEVAPQAAEPVTPPSLPSSDPGPASSAASSPFAAQPASKESQTPVNDGGENGSGDESSEVEALLSQFKQRFGQPNK